MFLALQDRFDNIQHINTNCSADEIEADVILFYDVHSSHHIIIQGISKHPAVKIEYFNDPHQTEFRGYYQDGLAVHKLDAKQRSLRAQARGVRYIICPYREGYNRFIAPHIGDSAKLIWFPVAPPSELFRGSDKSLIHRTNETVMNGHSNPGNYKDYYKFRNWASKQAYITNYAHCLLDDQTPRGGQYGAWLSQFVASVASCNFYPIPKYFEIPLAGCLCLAQYHKEYEELGFEDGKTCLYVNEQNLQDVCNEIKKEPAKFQSIANAGRNLVLTRYTARHFADHIYNKVKETL